MDGLNDTQFKKCMIRFNSTFFTWNTPFHTLLFTNICTIYDKITITEFILFLSMFNIETPYFNYLRTSFIDDFLTLITKDDIKNLPTFILQCEINSELRELKVEQQLYLDVYENRFVNQEDYKFIFYSVMMFIRFML